MNIRGRLISHIIFLLLIMLAVATLILWLDARQEADAQERSETIGKIIGITENTQTLSDKERGEQEAEVIQLNLP